MGWWEIRCGESHDPDVQWDGSNARGKTGHLYNKELVKVAPLLSEPGVGGHVWWVAPNKICLSAVPEADRVRQLWHTAS